VRPALFGFQYNADPALSESKQEEIETSLLTLERVLADRGADSYLAGSDEFTLADCHVLPFLHQFLLVCEKGLLSEDKFPQLR
jgi:glutathione S-transferase